MLAIQSLLLACLGSTIAAPTPGQPAPVPSGGVGVRANDSAPLYHTITDFDFQSFNLGLYQEWIEEDLFSYIARRFSVEEFAQAGLNEEDISLIQFMANQEVGHATLLSNIVSYGGRSAAQQCKYKYDFNTVREAVDFSQKLTRWGESGVYGFLSHLDSRESANLLTQSIATEARQQMILRQFSGAHPMPVYFETGISQAMSWSLLQRYIISCPEGNPRVEWPIFPSINVTNGKSLLVDGYEAAITHNRTSLTSPGQQIDLTWGSPQMNISADGMYNSSVGPLAEGKQPAFVVFVSQLNATYSPLEITGNNSGTTTQPEGVVFDNTDDGIVNGTMFIGITDTDLYVTPYNLSLLNDHLFAWDIYQAN